MNKKRITNIFILTLLLVLSAIFVSGAYSVSITAPDLNSFTSGNTTVTIAVFEDGVAANSSNNLTNITVEAVQGSTVVSIANITNSYSTDANFNLTNATYSFAWDTSNGSYSDGQWSIRVNVTGNLSNSSFINTSTNTSTVYAFTVDNTKPNSTVVLTGTKNGVSSQTLTSVGEIDYATEATLDCGAADNISGLNTSRSSVQVRYPGIASFANITSSQLTIANETLKGKLISSDTDVIGSFEMKCMLFDLAGNTFTNYFNLSTISVVVDKGSPFVDPNFVSPIAKTVIGKGTVENYATKYGPLPEDGEARLIKKLGGIILLIADEEHTVMVDDVGDDSVTITISSEPFTIDILVGEAEEVDVNADGVNDLEIFLHKIHQKAADLVFKEISVPVVMEEEIVEAPIITEEIISEVEEERDLGWLKTLLILVVVALILMWAVHMFSRRSRGDSGSGPVKFTPRDLGAKREEITSWGSPDVSSKKGSKPFY